MFFPKYLHELLGRPSWLKHLSDVLLDIRKFRIRKKNKPKTKKRLLHASSGKLFLRHSFCGFAPIPLPRSYFSVIRCRSPMAMQMILVFGQGNKLHRVSSIDFHPLLRNKEEAGFESICKFISTFLIYTCVLFFDFSFELVVTSACSPH